MYDIAVYSLQTALLSWICLAYKETAGMLARMPVCLWFTENTYGIKFLFTTGGTEKLDNTSNLSKNLYQIRLFRCMFFCVF